MGSREGKLLEKSNPGATWSWLELCADPHDIRDLLVSLE